jgi:SAM-dependent methyltransferase
MKSSKWYQDWFNSPYYHILYKHRDDHDAQVLIKHLVEKIKPQATDLILDLACGRGRHAVFLNQLGYNVVGLDLSESNICFAGQFENQTLKFEQGDMRKPYGKNRFDFIFNLFTSFGYFSDREQNQEAVHRMAEALKPEGILVLDFMNVNKVILGLVEEETVLVEDINFKINRKIRDEQVIKSINFEHEGQKHLFEERVQLFTLADFKALFDQAGLKIISTYGDFKLNPFDERNSERLLLFLKHS